MYWPDEISVSIECNIRLEHDHVLTLEPLATTDLPPVGPTTAAPNIPRNSAEPTPTDLLKGLKGTKAAPPEGCGARAKRPLVYVHCILTGEGSTTGEVGNQSLPCGIPGASVAEATQDNVYTPLYAMAARIPAGTEPINEAKAHGSLDWPHWKDAMAREVSKMGTS